MACSRAVNGLDAPLPEGTKRTRTRNSIYDEETESQPQMKPKQKKKENGSGHVSTIVNTRDVMIYKFDGASRNNGTPQAKCAIGIFAGAYDSPFNVSSVDDKSRTNNEAEITAATISVRQLIAEHKQTSTTHGAILGTRIW